jgi:CubicO group peptidase (beta-lactamase class C family)
VRELLERLVGPGFVPGAVVVLARHGEVHVEATGTLAFEGAGAGVPMARDTIVRMASMTKPIVAACAMTLVEDCTLRLDDPVDDLLPDRRAPPRRVGAPPGRAATGPSAG